MTLVEPRVSTECSRRTMALCFAIWLTPSPRPTANSLFGVTFTNGLFVAVGSDFSLYQRELGLADARKEKPQEIVDLVIVVDDASKDATLAKAATLDRVVTHAHARNMGYGANQKTCYRLALEHGAEERRPRNAADTGLCERRHIGEIRRAFLGSDR
mgnify:CR=1 FL=1